MAEYELHIPSAISQSCFYQDGEITTPKPNEFNYFIALLYLYRTNLIEQNSGTNIFIEDGEKLTSKQNPKQMLNPDFNQFTVQIELSEFDNMGVVSNNDYTLLKTYLEDKLDLQYIEIDILGTKKLTDNTRIAIIDTLTIDNDNILEITFTTEFVKMILHCEKYWMNVNLENVFDLTSHKAQKLYLLVKDYSTHPDKCVQVSSKQLEMIIGEIPQKQTRDNLCKTISDNTDMKISIGKPIGNKLKKYKINFSENKNAKKQTKSKQKPKSKPKPKEIDENLLATARAKTEASIKKGNIVNDKEVFTWSIYHKLVKEQKHQLKQPNKEALEEAKEALDKIIMKDYSILLMKKYSDYIGIKDYKLYYLYGDDENKPFITNNALETLEVLNSLKELL